MNVLVVYYSLYGQVHRRAEAIAEGAGEVPGTHVSMRRVPETLPHEVLVKMGAVEKQAVFTHIPICGPQDLSGYDAILFGTPTRFGNMCGQMRQFLDATGKLWSAGALRVSGAVGLAAFGALMLRRAHHAPVAAVKATAQR